MAGLNLDFAPPPSAFKLSQLFRDRQFYPRNLVEIFEPAAN